MNYQKHFLQVCITLYPHFNKKKTLQEIKIQILFYVHIICKTYYAAKCCTDGLNVIKMAFTFINDRNVRFYKFTFLHNSVQILILKNHQGFVMRVCTLFVLDWIAVKFDFFNILLFSKSSTLTELLLSRGL